MLLYVIKVDDTPSYDGTSVIKGGILGLFTTLEFAEESIQKILNCAYFQGTRGNFTIIPYEPDRTYLWKNV